MTGEALHHAVLHAEPAPCSAEGSGPRWSCRVHCMEPRGSCKLVHLLSCAHRQQDALSGRQGDRQACLGLQVLQGAGNVQHRLGAGAHHGHRRAPQLRQVGRHIQGAFAASVHAAYACSRPEGWLKSSSRSELQGRHLMQDSLIIELIPNQAAAAP